MTLVTFDDVVSRLDPRPPAETKSRVEVLIGDAEQEIRVAFLKAGRDFDAELVTVPWLRPEAEKIIREMVSAAVIIGPNAGVRTVASSTGQESDSITYADVNSVSFGGVRLTDEQREALGLLLGRLPRGRFPGPLRWPEVRRR